MRKKRTRIILSLLLVTSLLVGLFISKYYNFQKAWQDLVFEGKDFAISRVDESNLIFQNEDILVKISMHRMSGEDFKIFYDNQVVLLGNYYRDYESPYSGRVSSKIVCSPEQIPTRHGDIISYRVNQRFSPTGCMVSREDSLLAEMYSLKCGNNYYILRKFHLKKNDESEHFSIGCRK